MKRHTRYATTGRVFSLLFLAFAVISSCNLFHFQKINPYNDLTSDHLKKYHISKLRIVVADSIRIYPGASFPIDVIALTPTKRELKTRGLPKGYVNWSSYAVRVQGGTFENGVVTVNNDPRFTGNPFKIFVYPYYYPEVTSEIILPLSYKAKFVAECKGMNGANGGDGLAGGAADSAKVPRVYKGRRGQNGTDGGAASDGCLADVYVKAMTVSDKQLMNVLVVNHCDNSHTVFWIDPDGGSLLVDVSGGDGGKGGNGGDGEKGMDGAGVNPGYQVQPYPMLYYPVSFEDDRYYHNGYYYFVDLAIDTTKNPGGNGGNGGIGGNGGRGGDGGNGGVAVIHLDSAAVQWKDKITISNNGGKAGIPGIGGYAGLGGQAAYGMQSKVNGKTGYIGAEGLKGRSGRKGSPAIYKVEKVKMAW